MEPGTVTTTSYTSSLIAAHPVSVAIIGGILIGAGTYYIMKALFGKKAVATS